MSDPELYDDNDEGVMCPHCNGGGWLNCYCGGDLCVCENQGEYDCPLCDGEGLVSEGQYNAFFECERAAQMKGGE